MSDSRIHLLDLERGTRTAVRHRIVIFEPYVSIFTEAVGPNFNLMDDSVRHIELIWEEFLESKEFPRMDWQVRYRDFIRINHAWDTLKRAIETRNNPPRTTQDLKTELLNEWN
ncbi:transposable element Tcb2 transposase [Trichonephila clavipes]|nr:transposable element Tcb2 transposase [Trichonephila clavipes]